MGYVTWRPFQGMSPVGWDLLWLTCTPNLKSIFIHNEDMKGNAKCRIWSDLGFRGVPKSPAMSPIDRASTTSYSTFRAYRKYIKWLYLVPFSRYSELFVESRAYLTYPTCIWRPSLGLTPFEFRQDLWHPKTGVFGYRVAFAWFCV